jgi:S1-C subfamily serine protease
MERDVVRALWLLLALVGLAGVVHGIDLPDLADRAKPSVVLVTVYDASGSQAGTGTGFFVSEEGRLVTNDHVIEGASRATVTRGGRRRGARQEQGQGCGRAEGRRR